MPQITSGESALPLGTTFLWHKLPNNFYNILILTNLAVDGC